MRIPCSTYRIQFNPDFGFRKAQAIVDYLWDLGITDLYASPIFNAREGSIHGYDVLDPTILNPQLGSEVDFQALTQEIQSRGMGWLQDIVPNHMAFDGGNSMLMDVFENGESSLYYNFFDIEWNHAYESMKGRLLSPFLGRSYGECLERGDLKVQYSQAGFAVHYFSLRFPLRIESYYKLLTPHLDELKERMGSDHPDFVKLIGVVYVLKAFPCQESAQERYDEIRFAKRMLWELYTDNPHIKGFIQGNLDELNNHESSESLDRLDRLLIDQFYRLSYWKVASEEINYRRFFSINELISLKMEDPDVFERCNALIFQLVREGIFTGLRIDHIDGLYDPLQYLKKLQESTGGIYVTVEKILALTEDLPSKWPVEGTSGYDFMNYVNGIFCRKDNAPVFNRIYNDFTREALEYENLIYEKKGIIVERFMTGDVDNLAHLMKRLSSMDRGSGDITLHGLRRAIYEVLSFFPVYRTYISPDSFTDLDRRYITEAFARAVQHKPDLLNELKYLRQFLMLSLKDHLSDAEKKAWIHFVMRFQQFTGPLMAKGFEDTTLYVYNRLISLNEVGGEPYSFGLTLDEFHQYNTKRTEQWPHAMSATSTHDTKRGEDMRARINVLSEIPEEWEARVKAWQTMNHSKKLLRKNLEMPSRNDEYFLYQTLIGAWPFEDEDDHSTFTQRIKDYIIKAIREAKVYTGWIVPDEKYEGAYVSFIDRVLDRSNQNEFLEDFLAFQRKVAHYGIFNSLSQTLLKITSPGVPDFYQGTELWEFSLVDPDNRRPVDYDRRKAYLREVQLSQENPSYLEQLIASRQDGRVKFFLTFKALHARREYREIFEKGAYLPLNAEGELKEHVTAFARSAPGQPWAVTVAPRFFTGLVSEGEIPIGSQAWKDTAIRLPGGTPVQWTEVFTGQTFGSDGTLRLGELLNRFPVALLIAGA